jgi:hypothetical protein
VKRLETNKTDVKMTERNGKRVNDLTMEVRQALKEHDTIIHKCSTYDDLSVKANILPSYALLCFTSWRPLVSLIIVLFCPN